MVQVVLHRRRLTLEQVLVVGDRPPGQMGSGTQPLPKFPKCRERGCNRHLDQYRSIQHDLPDVFGVGRAGLPESVTPLRQAQARQLAAYLTLFEQVLADSLSLLANACALLSWKPTPSYLAPNLTEAPRRAEVTAETVDNSTLQTMVEHASGDGAEHIRRFLAHLLARFAEDFQDLSMLRETNQCFAVERAFLREYRAISGIRARAFDYTQPSWENSNKVSGLERRIAFKPGLTSYCRQPLAGLKESDPGGFHLIEHLLLRPGKADCESVDFTEQVTMRDPYSAQLSFVFPDWITAFKPEFSSLSPFLRKKVMLAGFR